MPNERIDERVLVFAPASSPPDEPDPPKTPPEG